MRRPFDLGHGGAHAVAAEAMDGTVDTPVGVPKHPPDGTAPPRRGWRWFAESDTGEGSLGDGVEGCISGRDMGAELLVEALRRQREPLAAIKPVVLHYVGEHPRRGELGLEVGQVLTFVGANPEM